MFVVRQTKHIQEDIKRNWSSWNYGQEGITATENEFNSYLEYGKENNCPLLISGMEIWPDDFDNSVFGELYENYWVLIDNNFKSALACNILNAENLDKAIKIVSAENFQIELGEGDAVDCSNAKIVYSNNDIHILEIK